MSDPTPVSGGVPLLDPDTRRFPDKYTPQAVLDAVGTVEQAVTDVNTAKGEAEQARTEAVEAAASVAPGEPGGTAQLDEDGKLSESQTPAHLTPPALEATTEQIVDERVPGQVAAVIADDPTVAQAAADLAQSDAGLVRSEWIEADAVEFAVEDDPETPIVSFSTLDLSTGWRWAFAYRDGEVAFGQRADGSFYPDLGEAPAETLASQVVGDSVAENWGAYAAGLSAATARTVSFEGIGGQRSPAIAARQGGVPAYVTVTGNSIPASGTVVVTSITEPDGTALNPLLTVNDSTRTRTVVIGGALCTLTGVTVSGSTTYTLAQQNGTGAIPCAPGTPMVPRDRPSRALTILLGPRNDLGPSSADAFRQPLEKILARYSKMIDRAKRDGGKVILLPVVPRADATADGKANLVILNNALRDLAPQDWADWNAWLQSDAAFTAAGVTKTSQDIADIDNALTPTSFTGDGLHPNAAGYAAANRFIELVRTARGI
ncbi:SGNH/GDSL hydrolase family protein [Microbacterium dauci]|uniref:SGNH hydrolase-type esterase domain-containing protein n=1 Tax=Microbacterium dauci TaxID=3048008 RepID=A0ABT6ZAS5_9MICO|nr:GDSL-type esterase/lipase family protein [Microbacterium sp. LX3-4]MDJ1113254.1 hypothetical protein [Microbacterium sp. LX3-4]